MMQAARTKGVLLQTREILQSVIERLFGGRWVLPVCLLVSLAFRLVLVAALGRHQHFYDEGDYREIALSLVHGGGYSLYGHPTAFRPPAMPFFLAACMAVAGDRFWVFTTLQAVILCVLPFLVLRIAKTIGLPTAYATMAGVVTAFHPGLNYATTTLYPTSLTASFLALSVLLTALATSRNSAGFGVLAGISAGITGLATTVFVPFGLVLALVTAVRRRLVIAVCLALVSLVPLAIWVTRNYFEVKTFAVATNGGFNLALGANDLAEPRSGNGIELDQDTRVGEVALDANNERRATAWIHAHRLRYAELFVLRVGAVLDSVGKPVTRGVHDSVMAKVSGWILLPVILLSLVGLFLYRRTSVAWMTSGALLLVMVSSGLSIVKPRFRFPCDPLLLIFSVAAFYRWSHPDAASERQMLS